MKVIYFSLDYTPHDHRFLAALAESEHEIFHVRLQRGPRQTEDRPIPSKVRQVAWAGGQSVFRWRDLLKYVAGMRRITRDVRPDLIHAGPVQPCAFIAVLAGFSPILTMSWGYDLVDDVHRSRFLERVTRYTLKRSTFFTSDAAVTRDKAVSYGMHPERTVVFPWGVDLDRFHPAGVELPSEDGFVLFCNRTWEPIYGIDVLARAFVQVAASRPDVSLILLSGGSQAGNIRQILLNGGVLDRVHFAGHVSQANLPDWYHKADLYISPSHVDGSSVSLLEAMASGLPCLVSDIPGNREWIRDGENGWLFPDGDAGSLAGKILQVIAIGEKLPAIGRAARATAEVRANWKENAIRLLEAYENAVRLR